MSRRAVLATVSGPLAALARHARARRALWETYILDHELGLFEETAEFHRVNDEACDAYRAVPRWLDWAAWIIERHILITLDFHRRMGQR